MLASPALPPSTPAAEVCHVQQEVRQPDRLISKGRKDVRHEAVGINIRAVAETIGGIMSHGDQGNVVPLRTDRTHARQNSHNERTGKRGYSRAREAIVRPEITDKEQDVASNMSVYDQIASYENAIRTAIINKNQKELEKVRTHLLEDGRNQGISEDEIHTLFETMVSNIQTILDEKISEKPLVGETVEHRTQRISKIVYRNLKSRYKGENAYQNICRTINDMAEEGRLEGFEESETFNVISMVKKMLDERKETISRIRAKRKKEKNKDIGTNEKFAENSLNITPSDIDEYEKAQAERKSWKEFTKKAHLESEKEARKGRHPEAFNEQNSEEYEKVGATKYGVVIEERKIEANSRNFDNDSVTKEDEAIQAAAEAVLASIQFNTVEKTRRIRYPEAFSRWDSMIYERGKKETREALGIKEGAISVDVGIRSIEKIAEEMNKEIRAQLREEKSAEAEEIRAQLAKQKRVAAKLLKGGKEGESTEKELNESIKNIARLRKKLASLLMETIDF